MIDKVSRYIKENWKNTIHKPQELRGDVKIFYPYIAPSISGDFTDFYYWDTYFINIGLLIDGMEEQAENNLNNIARFIEVLGYMPNANYMRDRSQPPLFTRGVYDYYLYKNDKQIIKKYIDAILTEYSFWQEKRQTPIGLNAYGTHGTEEEILQNYEWHHPRVKESGTTKEEKLLIGKNIMAIAESGFDFNVRFRTKESNISAHEFAHLDLNCFLYDAEVKIAEMLAVIGREDKAQTFYIKSEKRKELINRYFFDRENGIYLDYNFVSSSFSAVLSVVSLMPFAFKISDDKDSALKVLKMLELPFGISAAEYRGDDIYLQWDYPVFWPCMAYIAYIALMNIGCADEAKRIARKYLAVVNDNFDKTGRIWEKYDASNGGVAVTSEYTTQEMIGWSAAIYRYFAEELK
jgi:alpha,alpha-trehalase